jgi:hypothetical protein
VRRWLAIAGILSIVIVGLALSACDGGDDNGDDGSDNADDGAAVEYRVIVNFNETAEQADLDETAEILAVYDPLMRDFLIRETFPPTGDTTLVVDDPGFCDDVTAELEAKSYVDSVDCGPAPEPADGNPDEPVSNSDDEQTSLACAEGEGECNDIPNDTCFDDDCETNGGAPALPPDEGVAPSSGEYQIRISFNTSVQQDEIDEVGTMIRDFDPNAEYVVQESFPPTGVGNFVADTEDVCLALTQQLGQASFVASVSCEPYVQLEPGDPDPDEPVTNDLP